MRDEAMRLLLFFKEKRGELLGLKPKTKEQMVAIHDLVDFTDKRIDLLVQVLKDVETLEAIDFTLSVEKRISQKN